MSDTLAASTVPFLDMAANQMDFSKKISDFVAPSFAALGLALDSFVVENLSLPDELQKRLDERIGMAMVGDMNRYTQFQVAQSMPIAAANEGGGAAGIGAGLGAGVVMANQMMNALNRPGGGAAPADASSPAGGAAAAQGETKFCSECGTKIPKTAKFCSNCGKAQG
jgi:membrane protease subunit (stomatin/prohibitin family)